MNKIKLLTIVILSCSSISLECMHYVQDNVPDNSIPTQEEMDWAVKQGRLMGALWGASQRTMEGGDEGAAYEGNREKQRRLAAKPEARELEDDARLVGNAIRLRRVHEQGPFTERVTYGLQNGVALGVQVGVQEGIAGAVQQGVSGVINGVATIIRNKYEQARDEDEKKHKPELYAMRQEMAKAALIMQNKKAAGMHQLFINSVERSELENERLKGELRKSSIEIQEGKGRIIAGSIGLVEQAAKLFPDQSDFLAAVKQNVAVSVFSHTRQMKNLVDPQLRALEEQQAKQLAQQKMQAQLRAQQMAQAKHSQQATEAENEDDATDGDNDANGKGQGSTHINVPAPAASATAPAA